MLDEKIRERLLTEFEGAQILFWEDTESEFADAISDLELDDIQVVIVDGDEFAVKRRLLRGSPDAKYIVYRAGGAPDRLTDYLLDVKVASRVFTASQAAVWARDCGIPDNLLSVVNKHEAFFADKERRASLRSIVENADWFIDGIMEHGLELALVSLCCKVRQTYRADALRDIGKAIIREYANDVDTCLHLIDRCELWDPLWSALAIGYGYQSDNPSVEDFVLAVVLSANGAIAGNTIQLNSEADILMSSLSRDRKEAHTFENLISRTASFVQRKSDFTDCPHDVLIANQYLPDVDIWLLEGYAQSILEGVECSDELKRTIARRSGTFWFQRFARSYEALLASAELNKMYKSFEREARVITSAKDYYLAYVTSWWHIDEAYRRYIISSKSSDMPKLPQITASIEPRYGQFLRELASRWQDTICLENTWPPSGIQDKQRNFFSLNVAAASQANRVAVIISDALRYESAMQLKDQFEKSGIPCDVEAGAMLATAPSFTQLGMASLLPNKKLTFDAGTQHAYVDDMEATGTLNRQKILNSKISDAIALSSADLLGDSGLGGSEEAPLAYIYHNKVDKIGDSRDTEREVFDAVQDACEQIENILGKLFKLGYQNVYVTADHGYLYQDGDPSFFEYAVVDLMDAIVSSGEAKRTRRFVAAPDLPDYDDMIIFDAASLGLEGDFKVGFPKGIRRFRLKGSGARFVHGGITLQETVIPLIKIKFQKKSRKNKSRPVGVAIHAGGKQLITGADISFTLLQDEAVSDNRVAQHIRVGVYDEQDNLVSSQEEFELDSTVSDAGARKTQVRLTVSSSVPNGAKVTLKVEGRYGVTNHYSTIASTQYTIRRNFGMDF